jgi:hypothetical protein
MEAKRAEVKFRAKAVRRCRAVDQADGARRDIEGGARMIQSDSDQNDIRGARRRAPEVLRGAV